MPASYTGPFEVIVDLQDRTGGRHKSATGQFIGPPRAKGAVSAGSPCRPPIQLG